MNFDEFNLRRIADYEELLHRLSILEQRRGLSALGFGSMPESSEPAERVAALHALTKWRVERLESLQNVN